MYTRKPIIVIGAGLSGLAVAAAMAALRLPIVILEKQDEASYRKPFQDGRSLAVSLGSSQWLESWGVWGNVFEDAQPILDIRVVDKSSPQSIHFENSKQGLPMGYICPIDSIKEGLLKQLATYPWVTFQFNTTILKLDNQRSEVSVTLEDGNTIGGELAVLADGRLSQFREALGIKSIVVPYRQSALSFTISHEMAHGGLALERFLPDGPFAVLPMKGDYLSSIVFTLPEAVAPLYLTMPEAEFNTVLQERVGDYLGKVSLHSKRFSYPLRLAYASCFYSNRVALIGDAAHGVHPLAGQGFNLGIRDIACLVKQINKAQLVGLSIANDKVLRDYHRLRQGDSLAMTLATDAINRLFSNNHLPLSLLRRMGLSAVNRIDPLKDYFMRHAMGVTSFLQPEEV
ncbi:MAG: UbiH/UbiF/VisC/COQ6 family ubiquinone biosynthesis hydroxylase [Alphaproteobacteria bacterium]|nr:UbiH/UbiF/VisC/COQ6 family ubiquinone biosynthesis hydroxylase [Alphaproteobacteria bacterium]